MLNSIFKEGSSHTIPRKYHIAFWIGYFTLNFIRWGSYYQDYWYSFKSNLLTVSIGVVLVYVNIYFLFPKFILNKKYTSYIFYFFITLSIFYVVRTELIYALINENVWPESDTPQKAYSFNHIIVVFMIGIYDVALVTTLKLTTDWIFERKRTERLKEVQMRTELNLLKSQIQPHFFFNTLNSLYALAINKSEDTPRVILKLSDMMQYALYEVKDSKVELLKEINHINNYIDIEKMRFNDRIESNMNITGNIDDVEIPPLLFLSFVENCFKHGLKGVEKINIDISFEITKKNDLEFRLINNFNADAEEEENHGIGIMNSQRRLTLLYDNDFILETHVENNTYNLFLKIPVL
ncbi:sensor histidine kinase [uncultured Kordia sp.]|uniref:sensor histidine kinase n=1 Tax=uncultured Kordia sp. TaxID=507699 RepID=UPI00260BDAF7|nr:histidine kinase [uncultured Kordia sp.]